MPILIALLAAPASAGGLHAGIAIADVQALHAAQGQPPRPPAFGTAETGWSLIIPSGLVFIYVAPTQDQVEPWLALQLERQRKPPIPVEQPAQGIDQAWRHDTDFALLQDGNIGIMVQGTPEATEEAAVVHGLITDIGPPWPDPPHLVQDADGAWSVQAPDALQIAWQGGRRKPGPGPRFSVPPDKLVAWDALGRAAVAWPTGKGPGTPSSEVSPAEAGPAPQP